MRTVVSHTFVTLDGVATPDVVIDAIVELRNTEEVLDDSSARWPTRTPCCSAA
jgi:hypothetical protein